MYKLFSFFPILLATFLSAAQAPLIKESAEVSFGFSEASIFKPADEFVYVVYGKPGHDYSSGTEVFHPQKLKSYNEGILNKYDKNFKLLSSFELKKDGKDLGIEGFYSQKQKLYGLFSDGSVFCQEMSAANSNWAGDRVPLFKSSSVIGNLYVSSSSDSVYQLITAEYSQKDKETSSFTGIFLKDMQAHGVSFDFSLGVTGKELDFFQFFPVNGQEFCVVFGAKKKDNEDNNEHYYISRFDNIGKLKATKEINLGDAVPGPLAFHQQNEELVFWGMFSTGKKKSNTGFLSGHINVTSLQTGKLITTEFNNMPSLLNGGKYYKNLSEDGVDKDFSFKNYYQIPGGSFYLIYEEGYHTMGQRYVVPSGTLNGSGGNSYPIKNFNRGDVAVIKVNAKGEVEWIKIVSKNQLELELSIREGIVTVLDSKMNLHILFNDGRKNDDPEPSRKPPMADISAERGTNLFHVIISPSGNVDKQLIFENKERETWVSPDYSIGIGNEIYFSAGRSRALKKSSYTFGSIRF